FVLAAGGGFFVHPLDAGLNLRQFFAKLGGGGFRCSLFFGRRFFFLRLLRLRFFFAPFGGCFLRFHHTRFHGRGNRPRDPFAVVSDANRLRGPRASLRE